MSTELTLMLAGIGGIFIIIFILLRANLFDKHQTTIVPEKKQTKSYPNTQHPIATIDKKKMVAIATAVNYATKGKGTIISINK